MAIKVDTSQFGRTPANNERGRWTFEDHKQSFFRNSGTYLEARVKAKAHFKRLHQTNFLTIYLVK